MLRATLLSPNKAQVYEPTGPLYKVYWVAYGDTECYSCATKDIIRWRRHILALDIGVEVYI